MDRAYWRVAVFAVLVTACADIPTDKTPSGALRLFVDALDRSGTERDALEDAYRLLDHRAQHALRERAARAEAIGGGRSFSPWEMIAQGRHQLAFRPARRNGYQETIDADRAIVTVTGEGGEHASVRLVREQGAWRVALELSGEDVDPP